MPSANGVLPNSAGLLDDLKSLYYNPFAGRSESGFSSATSPKKDGHVVDSTKPAIRRRGSEGAARRSRNDHDPWNDDDNNDWRKYGSHARAMTVDTISPTASSSATSLHPLSSAGTPRSAKYRSPTSPSVTRPRLRRALSDGKAIGSSSQDENVDEDDESPRSGNSAPPERVVIVHKVTPSDSLAGVALKYGISLADLRRANQMWASDSIHLRDILYIPLEQAYKSKHLTLSILEAKSTPSTHDHDPSFVSLDDEMTPTVESLRASERGNNLTIRRVPASQLAFFPPPSSSNLAMDTSRTARTLPRSFHPSQIGSHVPNGMPSRTSSGSSTNPSSEHTPGLQLRSQLTSLFSALPIAPSTRDTIIARLSLDSGASTPSQVSDEQEHELEDVGSSSWKALTNPHEFQRSSYTHARPSHERSKSKDNESGISVELSSLSPPSTPSRIRSNSNSQYGRGTSSLNGRRMDYTSLGRPLEKPDVVRTSQLEPSPAMQLPIQVRRDREPGR
ncbi:hypothetical protein C8Q75DRAFT_809908 [Abortiporus biennis]|nr:hypothetical protein C8Q75DRAFT_809908 [Abortiporus biennis]